jgi:putative ABC transport system permease protein
MRLEGLAKLAATDVKATPARSAIAAAGIGLGVMVLLVIAGLGLGARDAVLTEVVRQLPLDMIEVVPKTLDLGLFRAANPFGVARLEYSTLERLRQVPGVAAVYPKLEVRIPMTAQGGDRVFGRNIRFDLFMIGAPEELIGIEGFRQRDDGVIPVVISDQLIEVYNGSMAPALGFPKITNSTFVGMDGEIIVGRSMITGGNERGRERGVVVGVSPFGIRLGATVPMESARRVLAKYGEPGAPETYSGIVLKAGSPSDVPAIREAVEALGLQVDRTAEKTSDLLTAATALGSLVGLLVLALAALNIAHSFFAQLSERRRELAIMRAVGARRSDLVTIVLVQAALLGGIGGLGGVAAAQLAAGAIDAAAAALLPDFPFKPDSFFSMGLGLYWGGFLLAVAAAVLGALWPALAASRAHVARSLADS